MACVEEPEGAMDKDGVDEAAAAAAAPAAKVVGVAKCLLTQQIAVQPGFFQCG